MTAQQRFEALVLPHLDGLLGFASRRIGNAADAEDLVQEAMLRAWKGFETVREPASGRAWLFAIVRSVISDHRELNGRRSTLVEFADLEDEHMGQIAAADPGPLDVVIGSLSSERLRDALARVPEVYATAVELHDLHGFRYREIGEIVGAPIGSVMSRIHRGRKMLAELLLSEYGGADLSRIRRVR
jgi:RNA polymerase sigma-70 factor (ECF subfamily)